MWLFTQYGFSSAVCARDLAGDPTCIDPAAFMVRAERNSHDDRHVDGLQAVGV